MSQVFISYRQTDEEQRQRVRAFAERLRRCGIDVVLDQFLLDKRWGVQIEAEFDGRAKASRPCSVVRITASPTRIGEAELVSSSPVGRELICFPSFNPSTTPSELESGVKRAASSTVNGCAEMRPGNCFFQSIVPLRFK